MLLFPGLMGWLVTASSVAQNVFRFINMFIPLVGE